MKLKTIFLLSLMFVAVLTAVTDASAQGKKLRVMLDPSHGGADDGSIYSGVKEKDIVWAICLETMKLAKDSKLVEMKMSRSDDTLIGGLDRLYSQYQRVEIMNREGSDILVSVHNASEPTDEKVGGTQIFIPRRPLNTIKEHINLGAAMQNAFRGSRIEPWEDLLQLTDRGGYHILDSNPKPAILVEIGFMTNPHDIAVLKDPTSVNHFAKILLKGIEDYAKLANKKQDSKATVKTIDPPKP